MKENSNDIRIQVREYSDILEKLGAELASIQFSYKVKEITSKEYWENRIKNFKTYSEKGLEYYSQVYAMIGTINKDEARMFLLQISKFRQQSKTLVELMEKIEENPSIIDHKDKQQSRWSREIKNQIVQYSENTLEQEKRMNTVFREFYDKYLRDMKK